MALICHLESRKVIAIVVTRSPELESQLEEPWLRDYRDNEFFLIDGFLSNREKHTRALMVVDRDHISLILKECHDFPYMGHMSEDRTKERVASMARWPKWEQQLSEYISTRERCQKENRKHGTKYGILNHIEEPKHMGNHQHGLSYRTCPRRQRKLQCVPDHS
ncbi:hypothetical protein O181_007867 [Austropuccinia psidii MF-1]|uniref:Integrase zinc-binding domain-containing protein n=1 Tax=Austropuccinia psidii MF-1 TaxID=1389203 RepID=A0A9Q3BNM8_9BASI|nr:hypothetical protein [Austropuccinia psidii MF-1]